MIKTFLDRVSSPIAGPFMISWSLWNWKIIVHVFTSGAGAIEKINNIELLFNPWIGLILPLISTGCYIFGMPLLIIKFGEFESFCKRLSAKRDQKESLRAHLEHHVNFNSQFQLYRFLLNIINDNRKIFKQSSETLDSIVSNVIPTHQHHVKSVVNKLNESVKTIDTAFQDCQNLTEIVTRNGEIPQLKKLAEDIQKAIEANNGLKKKMPKIEK